MNWTIKLNPLQAYLGFLSQRDEARVREKMKYNCLYTVTFRGQRNGVINYMAIQRALDNTTTTLYLQFPLLAVNGVLMTRQCSGIIKTSPRTAKLLCCDRTQYIYQNAFDKQSQVRHIRLGNSMRKVYPGAFICSDLKTVDCRNVNSTQCVICKNSFIHCPRLTAIMGDTKYSSLLMP